MLPKRADISIRPYDIILYFCKHLWWGCRGGVSPPVLYTPKKKVGGQAVLGRQ